MVVLTKHSSRCSPRCAPLVARTFGVIPLQPCTLFVHSKALTARVAPDTRRRGETFDRATHEQGTEVKAITYSAMQINEKEDRTDVLVIVDI
eukprot:9499403-Pyramimonas_sp.AAC.2